MDQRSNNRIMGTLQLVGVAKREGIATTRAVDQVTGIPRTSGNVDDRIEYRSKADNPWYTWT